MQMESLLRNRGPLRKANHLPPLAVGALQLLTQPWICAPGIHLVCQTLVQIISSGNHLRPFKSCIQRPSHSANASYKPTQAVPVIKKLYYLPCEIRFINGQNGHLESVVPIMLHIFTHVNTCKSLHLPFNPHKYYK